MKILIASLFVLSLSGCTDLISYKDARNLKTTKIITPTPESEEVVVADLRDKQVKVEKNDKVGTDFSKPKGTEVKRNNVQHEERQEVQSVDKVHEVETKDMSNDLYWFFFSMMLMGMLGAGLIGIIEAIVDNKKEK